jgi:GNT-I family
MGRRRGPGTPGGGAASAGGGVLGWVASKASWMCGRTGLFVLSGLFCVVAAAELVFIASYLRCVRRVGGAAVGRSGVGAGGRARSRLMDDGGSNLRIGDVRASPRPIEPVAVDWKAPVEAPRVSWREGGAPAVSPVPVPAAVERAPATTLLESAPTPPVLRPPSGGGKNVLDLGSWPPFESWRASRAEAVDTSSLSAFVGSGGRFPVVVMAADRPNVLRQSLAVLLSARGVTASDVVVVQDGVVEEVRRAAEAYGVRVVQRERPGAAAGGGLRGSHMVDGSVRIAEQYGAALALMFDRVAPEAPGIIILEDDMLVSPDFYEYFHATAGLLEADRSLWAVSAWNDNGFAHTLGGGDELGLWRTRFFPGLGWLLSRRLWSEELRSKWPREHWDHWMRHPDRHMGRDVLVPRVPRDYHIGVRGTYMNREDHYRYFRSIAMQADGQLRWFGNPAAARALAAVRAESFLSDLRTVINGGCFLQSVDELVDSASALPVGVTESSRTKAVAYASSSEHQRRTNNGGNNGGNYGGGTATSSSTSSSPAALLAAERLFPGSQGCPWVVFVHATAARDNSDFRNIGGFFGLWHEPLRGSREGVRALRWGKEGTGVLVVVNAAGYARGGMDRRKDEMQTPFAVPPQGVRTLAAKEFVQQRVPPAKWARAGLPPTDWSHRPHELLEADAMATWRPGYVAFLPQVMPKLSKPPPTFTGFGADMFQIAGSEATWVMCALDDPFVETDFTLPDDNAKPLFLWGADEAKALRRIPWAPYRTAAYPDPSTRAPEASFDASVLLDTAAVSVRPIPAFVPDGAYAAMRPRRQGPRAKASSKSGLDTEELGPQDPERPQDNAQSYGGGGGNSLQEQEQQFQQQRQPEEERPPIALFPTAVEGAHRLVEGGATLRTLPPEVIVLASGRPGASCDEVCSEGSGAVGGGLTCVDEALTVINKCPWLQAAFPSYCNGNCSPSIGSDQPAFISERAPVDKAPGACFFTSERDYLRCDGHWEFAHRLCPCTRTSY